MGGRLVILEQVDGLWDVVCRSPRCGYYRGGYETRRQAAKVRIHHEAYHRKLRRLKKRLSRA